MILFSYRETPIFMQRVSYTKIQVQLSGQPNNSFDTTSSSDSPCVLYAWGSGSQNSNCWSAVAKKLNRGL